MLPNSPEQRRIGIALVSFTTLMFASLDALAKFLVQELPVLQVVWLRFATHVLIMAALLWPQHGRLLITVLRPRLHFLRGRLDQLSMSAEVQFYDVVVAHLRVRNGAPLAAPAGEALRWQDEAAQIAAYRGKDLIFVNFQMASYADAVKRKREGTVFECY